MVRTKKAKNRYPKYHKDGTLCTLASDFPAIAKEWDYDRNENLPSAYAPGSNHKAYWRCPKGHGYQAPICKRTMRGNACPYCSGRRILAGFNDLLTLMPQLAMECPYGIIGKNGEVLILQGVAPFAAAKSVPFQP